MKHHARRAGDLTDARDRAKPSTPPGDVTTAADLIDDLLDLGVVAVRVRRARLSRVDRRRCGA